LTRKFAGLVGPVLGEARAAELADRIWAIDEADDVAPIVEMTALP